MYLPFLLFSGLGLALSIAVTAPVISESSDRGHRVVTCESGSPTQELFWTGPDGKRVEYSPTENIFSVRQEGKSSLIVRKLEDSQLGEYICSEHDVKGSYRKQAFHLHKAAGLPEFKVHFEDITVQEGSDVEILCSAEGDPTPEYIWYSYTGVEIVETEGNMFIKNVDNGLLLTIKSVTFDMKGMYACTAQNTHGLMTKTHRLNVVDSDGDSSISVEEVKTLEVTDNSVLFDVKLSESTTNEKDVSIQYNDSSVEASAQWNAGDKLEIKNLTAGGRYDFRFRVGKLGIWSARHQVVLLPAVPDVIVHSFAGGNLEIRFYRMGSDIRRYTIDKHRVSYTRLQMEQGERWVPSACNMTVEIPNCLGNQYLIAGLGNNVYYEIVVEAHTEAGYGKAHMQKFYVNY